MNTKTQNYQALRAKARRLTREIEKLERAVKCPSNFAKKGEVPHSTNIGWTGKTALFYTPSWVMDDLLARQREAEDKLPRLEARRARALKKAERFFKQLPWGERAALTMVGANPPFIQRQ